MIANIVSFGRCVVCPSSIYGYRFPVWYLQTFEHCIACPLLYGFWLPLLGIFKHLTIIFASPSIYGFWLLLSYFQMLGHYIVCSSIYGFNYPFGIFKVLVIVLSVLRRFTVSDFLFVFFQIFELIFVCPSSTCYFWLPSWYLQTVGHCSVCSSSYGFWLLIWNLQKCGRCVICPSSIYGFRLPPWYVQTFTHCIVCPPIYGIWSPVWYLQTVGHCGVCPSICDSKRLRGN